ncbi:alpha,alpha-phosphotrehalase [Alkalihalobacillus sp. LMS6]|uniref:alpha,alpha-phosphotrehalase n=1 Tax=Bacillaceae TaxID=186817 RepID=UPI000C0800A4|nr:MULTISPECIES: alpha,alpha-phosphotrehalase [Bacillaceae]UTR06916.1 alpha,alpha-phosphotrehalase [Alkalihalobacillus sp. LMS6]
MAPTNWWNKSTVYQIYPKSFNDTTGSGLGDIQGVIQKLDYLKDLGIDIIWLQPFYKSPQRDNGYDVADYKSVNPDYGTMEDIDQLITELKARDMHLMIDIVINHSSTEHKWFQEAIQSKDNSYRDYYIWRDPADDGGVPNNWQSKFGGPAWQYDENSGQYYLTLFDKTQADLNWENPEVREELADVVKFWADKGVTGLRLDVINLISKDQNFPNDEKGDGRIFYTDGPRVHEYLKELYAKVFGPYNLVTVGEMSSTTLEHCIRYSNPDEKELSMTFNFHHLKVDYPNGDKWSLKPYDFEELKRLWTEWQIGMNQNSGWNALFLNNHDQPRAISRFADDGVYREKSAKMLATTLHGLQGTPYVYQGEEIGMPNPVWNDISELKDIESLNMFEIMQQNGKSKEEALKIIQERSRDNGRVPMQWNQSNHAGFTEGEPWIKVDERYPEINVEDQVNDEDSVFNYYKKLIHLRKEEELLTSGTFKRLDEQHPELFAYMREGELESIMVVSNFSAKQVEFELPIDVSSVKQSKTLISTEAENVLTQTIKVPPYASYMWHITTA